MTSCCLLPQQLLMPQGLLLETQKSRHRSGTSPLASASSCCATTQLLPAAAVSSYCICWQLDLTRRMQLAAAAAATVRPALAPALRLLVRVCHLPLLLLCAPPPHPQPPDIAQPPALTCSLHMDKEWGMRDRQNGSTQSARCSLQCTY